MPALPEMVGLPRYVFKQTDFELSYLGLTDALRVFHLAMGGKYGLKDDETEYRYEQTGSSYRLQSWHNGAQKQMMGTVSSRPAWLSEIVTVAAVGGGLHRPTASPPDILIWFRLDDDKNLVEFIDILK